MAGNCSICFHKMRPQIDRWMREDQNFAPIMRAIREQAKKDQTVQVYGDKGPLKRHREKCLGLPTLLSSSGKSAGDFRDAPPGDPDDPVPTYEQLTEKARRHLDEKLPDLSADKLHALVVEGMKLERAKVQAKAKEREDEAADEGDDDAADEMRRARDRSG